MQQGKRQAPNEPVHFGHKQSGFLTKKRFEAVCDRLCKHLHAHNPWSGSKNLQNLAADLPETIEAAHGLLELHARVIRTPDFTGVWIVVADRSGKHADVIAGAADGPFVVKR